MVLSMYNSIQHFNEFGVEKLEKVLINFIEEEEKDIGSLVESVGEQLKKLQQDIISETLETIDDLYRNDAERKKKWSIVRSNDPNSFMSTCGEINYKRTYYISKETGERRYLADKAVGITPHMRISNDVVINALENAADSSYRASGEKAVYTDDIISKQAVMKQVHEIEIPKKLQEINKEKKKVKILYIDADEDHVSLQFNHEKGDIKPDNQGRKHNIIMPRLIYLHEGIEKEGNRNRLINKHYFGGVYSNSSELWEEVMQYIDAHYEEEVIEKIYISGDGAPWIKTGVEVLGAKSRFILDKYHLNKYIVKATSHLYDTTEDIRQEIYDAFSFEDKGELKSIFSRILDATESESKRKEILKSRKYILNHWEGIIIVNNDEHARIGCSAEGHISHIYADRLSSRPLGWSKLGVDKMARLRVYKANGGKICDLMKYRKDKEQINISKQIQAKYNKEIKKKRNFYSDAWEHTSISAQIGKRDGLYYQMKALRGICG